MSENSQGLSLDNPFIKQPNETYVLGFNFDPVLEGVAIASSYLRDNGNIAKNPNFKDTVATCRVYGGIVGQTYQITIGVVTAANPLDHGPDVYEQDFFIQII